MRKLFNDEVGFVVSAELVLVLTIAVLGMVVGLASVRDAINSELGDLSNAFGAVDQTYNVRGTLKASSAGGATKAHGAAAGFGFGDRGDDCDCIAVTYVDVCGKPDSSNGAIAEGNL